MKKVASTRYSLPALQPAVLPSVVRAEAASRALRLGTVAEHALKSPLVAARQANRLPWRVVAVSG